MQELATHLKRPQADPEGEVGSQFAGRYLIEAPLGRGGMAEVMRASQAPLGRPVALKLLSPKALQAGYGRRFFLEAATIVRLTHPHIVTLLDYGRAPSGTYFIAMELLEGQSLRQALGAARRPQPGLALGRALNIARQMARALRQAHRLGVAHRDLKPANVFLCRLGDEDDFVKILDFGLAKPLNTDLQENLTQPGCYVGTPGYMAPEQICGRVMDHRCDLYALGAILFEMVSGRPPFLGTSPAALLRAHLHVPAPPITAVAPGRLLPLGLEDLLQRCLAKAPSDRFPHVDAFLAALEPLCRAAAALGSPLPAEFTGGEASLSSTGVLAPRRAEAPPPGGRDALTQLMRPSGLEATRIATAVSPEPPPAPAAVPTRRRPLAWAAAAAGLVALGWGASGPTAEPGWPPILRLSSSPAGARVLVGDQELCAATPCSVVWAGGRPKGGISLRFLLPGYREHVAARPVAGAALRVHAPLKPEPI